MNTSFHPVVIDDASGRSSEANGVALPRDDVLVVYPRGDISELSGLELRQGQDGKPIDARSFAEACDAMLTCPCDVIVLLETSVAAFSAIELNVLSRLAGPARILRMKVPFSSKRLPQLPPGSGAFSARSVGNTVSETVRDGWHSVGGLVGEELTGKLWADGNLIHFSNSEAALVWVLLRAPSHLASKSDLVNAMRNPESASSDNKLRQFIHRIRRRLSDANDPAFLVARRNGYELIPPR
jgi:hypothetical protein